MLQEAGPVAVVGVAVGLLVAAGVLALLISRWAAWEPAGPIALIAASPLVPRIPLLFSLSLDDLAPLLGLAMLIWRVPVPRLTADRLLRVVLLAVALATVMRVASAIVNGGDVEGSVVMMAKAVARPALLVGIAAYAAVAMPVELRRRFVVLFMSAVGTIEAAFGLVAFAFPLPGGAGIEAARKLTTLYGVCPGRISGTLGLSPNHVGAVFVICLPLTVGLAIAQQGWRRWAWALAAVAQVVALMLTFTRSSILIGLAATLILLVYHRKAVLLAAIAAASVALLFGVLSLGCTTSSGGHGLPTNPGSLVVGRFGDSNDRLALWYAAGRIMLDHALVGVGLGRMDATLKADPQRYVETPFGPATSSAHNTILLAGAETGVLGALAATIINIGLGLVALRCAWRGRRERDPVLIAAGVAVGGYLVQGMVNNLFEIGATSALLALTIGAFAGASALAASRSVPANAQGLDRRPTSGP